MRTGTSRGKQSGNQGLALEGGEGWGGVGRGSTWGRGDVSQARIQVERTRDHREGTAHAGVGGGCGKTMRRANEARTAKCGSVCQRRGGAAGLRGAGRGGPASPGARMQPISQCWPGPQAFSMVPTPSLIMASTSRSVSWLTPLPQPFSLLPPAADSALTATLASSPPRAAAPPPSAGSASAAAAAVAGAGEGATGSGGFRSCGLPGEVLPALGPSVIRFLAAGAAASSAEPREGQEKGRGQSVPEHAGQVPRRQDSLAACGGSAGVGRMPCFEARAHPGWLLPALKGAATNRPFAHVDPHPLPHRLQEWATRHGASAPRARPRPAATACPAGFGWGEGKPGVLSRAATHQQPNVHAAASPSLGAGRGSGAGLCCSAAAAAQR